jgi:hypothetical protein
MNTHPQRRGNRQSATVSYDLVDFVCDSRRSQRLFKRCNSPALPLREPLYSKAKRLEYDGDIAGALDMFYKAMVNGERTDSCLKDIAGLLNQLGRTAEAVEFLRSHSGKVQNHVGFRNLLSRLEIELNKEASSDLPRSITISVVDEALGPVTLALCDRLFPNPAKIRRIIHNDARGFLGTVHFATHSSARKALQVRKLCETQVICCWSSLYADARLQLIERMEKQGGDCVSSNREEMLPHLKTFGWLTSIPIYREDDCRLPNLQPEDYERVDKLIASRESYASSTKEEPNPTITFNGTEASGETIDTPTSIEESMISSAPRQHTSNDGCLFNPFFSDITLPSGQRTKALIVPLSEYPTSQTTPSNKEYRTPVKPRDCLRTPSPVVEHYLFT